LRIPSWTPEAATRDPACTVARITGADYEFKRK